MIYSLLSAHMAACSTPMQYYSPKSAAAYYTKKELDNSFSQSEKEKKAKQLFVTSSLILSFSEKSFSDDQISSAVREANDVIPALGKYNKDIIELVIKYKYDSSMLSQIANGIKESSQGYVP